MPDLNAVLTGGAIVNSKQSTSETIEEDHCLINGIKIKPLVTPDDCTPEWFSQALNLKISPDGFKTQPVGTGHMSTTLKVNFKEEGSDEIKSVIAKFASQDASTRKLGLEFGHYAREAVFYRKFGDKLQAGLPKCYAAIVDKDHWFTIILEDMMDIGGVSGNNVEGCTMEEARLALENLAKLQGPVLNADLIMKDAFLNEPTSLTQEFYQRNLPALLSRYPPSEEHAKLIKWLGNNLTAWETDHQPPFAIFHGDYRLDNLIFVPKEGRCVAVDWGGLSQAGAMRDAAYFVGNGLTREQRLENENDLFDGYIKALSKYSGTELDKEACWREYRRQSLYGLTIHIPAAGVLPAATDRGKAMFQLLVSRQAQHAIDLDAVSLVEERKHLMYRPKIEDEELHPPNEGAGPLYNESFYFDALSKDGSAGVYIRIGRLPNQDSCTLLAGIFREGHTPITFIDMQGSLPEGDASHQVFKNELCQVTLDRIEALNKWRVQLSGSGKTFANVADSIEDKGTVISDIHLDLEWSTAEGLYPFKKPGQTRYEIPCTVNGSVKIDSKGLTFDQAPGNRNHSYGVRDWWQVDWVWSAFHFEDGTRMFTIALNQGEESAHPAGYIQKNGRIEEVTSVKNFFSYNKDGLVDEMKTLVQPGDLEFHIKCKQGGMLQLVSPEGKITQLPRSMGTVESKDGKLKGVAWIDCNHVIQKEGSTINGSSDKREAEGAPVSIQPAKKRRVSKK